MGIPRIAALWKEINELQAKLRAMAMEDYEKLFVSDSRKLDCAHAPDFLSDPQLLARRRGQRPRVVSSGRSHADRYSGARSAEYFG